MVNENVKNMKLILEYGSKKGSCTFGDMRHDVTPQKLYDTAVAINNFQLDPWEAIVKKVTSELTEG